MCLSSESPIEIVNLRKTFGSFTAVDGLTISIKKNSFTGLLGPNGAGKSTTLKVLTHLIDATSGEAYLNGIDVTKSPKAALTGVGTVVETPEFYSYLTPRETMQYIGEIIGLSEESISAQSDEILTKVKMTEWADKRIGTFSKGMRQRIALGQALLGEPSVIILDEPTSGLDPRGMAEIREILKNIRNGTHDLTILMSSHMLHEVSDLCDRIALVNHGKLLMYDEISKITQPTGQRKLTVRTVAAVDDARLAKIAKLDHVISADRSGTDIGIVLDMAAGDCRSQFFRDLAAADVGVCGLSEEDSLEAAYLSLIKESK